MVTVFGDRLTWPCKAYIAFRDNIHILQPDASPDDALTHLKWTKTINISHTIFSCVFVNEQRCILKKMSLKCVPKAALTICLPLAHWLTDWLTDRMTHWFTHSLFIYYLIFKVISDSLDFIGCVQTNRKTKSLWAHANHQYIIFWSDIKT